MTWRTWITGSAGVCWGLQCHLTNIHHSGSHAIQTSGRTQYYQGPRQDVTLEPRRSYNVSAYARLVNDKPGEIRQNLQVELSLKYTDDSVEYFNLANEPLARRSNGWIHLQGDFHIPDRQIKSAYIYFQGPQAGVDFIVDDVSVHPVQKDLNWRNESQANINKFRKSDIIINVHTHGSVDLSQVQVEIKQLKKSFPFGTAIACKEYYNGDTRYQNFIHQHFNWAVTENCLKWKPMERIRGHIDYDTPLHTLRKLRHNGIKIRAHNILWPGERFMQPWVKALSGDELRKAVHDRIVGVVSKTKDLVEHWDVNNENLHNFYYQTKLQDLNYNLDNFLLAHQTAPNVKMFLNEYNVVAGGGTTGAYLKQALKFKHANVGLGGIGVQCHFKHHTLDPTLIKKRLDLLAKAGVPVWVTELTVSFSDVNKRADAYETALRVLYSHPAVEGLLFWGFWNLHHSSGEPGALVSGHEFRINAAGHRVLHLLEKEWMTHETHTLSQSGKHFTVRGFHGDYMVHVRYRGREVMDQRHRFTLGKSSHTINLHVSN